jgi:hypothetical protein
MAWNNNEREQFTILFRPSIDSIEEVKVDTNSYPAEVGRAGGAVVNLITKSGANAYHGGLYEYFRNDKLNANDFFANTAGIHRAEFRQHRRPHRQGQDFLLRRYRDIAADSGKKYGLAGHGHGL